MNAKNKTSRLCMPLLAHLSLLVLLVADTYRRGGEGMAFVALCALCLITCLYGVLYFVANPREFFFLTDSRSRPALQAMMMRLIAWLVVVIVPVGWLLLTLRLWGVVESNAVVRGLMAYVFFGWVIGAMLLSPWLFGRRN